LVFFGFKTEGIDIDTGFRAVGVVLVRLNQVEVTSITFRESVVAVKLEFGGRNGVHTAVKNGIDGSKTELNTRTKSSIELVHVVGASKTSSGHNGLKASSLLSNGNTGSSADDRLSHRTGRKKIIARNTLKRVRGSATERGKVDSISVVEPLLTTESLGSSEIDIAVGLNNPNEFFDGVIEVEFDFVGSGIDGFITGELKLFNEVFVRNLGKTTTFISVEVDVVNIERSGFDGREGEVSIRRPEAFFGATEFKIDLDFVVLKGDKGKSKTGVAAKPELKGDIESGFRHTRSKVAITESHIIGSGTSSGTVARNGLNETSDVANHGSISLFVTSGLRKFIPDVEPVTVVAVNALTTDFDFHLSDHNVPEPVKPTELSGSGNRHTGKSDLKIHTGNKITVTRNSAGNLAAPISGTVEGLFNRFHRKVSVTTIHDFPEGNLRISGQVNILSTISDKLH